MDVKRALGYGALVYTISFAITLSAATLLGITLAPDTQPPASILLIGGTSTLLALLLLTHLYLKNDSGSHAGLTFGLSVAAMGFLIDNTARAANYLATGTASFQNLTDPLFYTILLGVTAVPMVMQWVKRRF